jgi:TPR repeat protein
MPQPTLDGTPVAPAAIDAPSPAAPVARHALIAARAVTQRQEQELRAKWSKVPAAELLKAAEGGDAEAEYCLGSFQMEQANVELDKAFRWGMQAEPTGPVFDFAVVEPKWKDRPRADLMNAVESGNREAQYYFARVGQVESVEKERAGFAWVRKAAEHGFVLAQFEVARACLARSDRVLTDKDIPAGMRFLELAVAKDYEPAIHLLASVLKDGDAGAPDTARAVALFKRAGDQGCMGAHFELAVLYANGCGEPRNDQETPVALFARLAAAGDAGAQLALADRYRTGLGVPLDSIKAIRGYQQAAKAQDGGWMQEQLQPLFGLVDDDLKLRPILDFEIRPFAEVLSLYLRATERQDATAMQSIGSLYQAGDRVPRDPVEACRWFNLAAARGRSEAAQARDDLKAKLTPEDFRRATDTAAALLQADPGTPSR